jgi:hypothetical protein
MQLNEFQDGFSGALLTNAPSAAPLRTPWLAALQAQPGFAVYRNTVLKARIDALQANHPAVCQMVGEDWFRAAAAVYAHVQPPAEGRLMNYGAGFSDFLQTFEPAAKLPYLGAVARLDRCWTECHLAADAPAFSADQLAAQPAHTLATLHLQPHPAARWSWCAEHPAYALWATQRQGMPFDADLLWEGDGGLLTRPQGAVVWHPLSQAGLVFLDACASGASLETAATGALTQAPTTDFAALLGTLLHAGALTHSAQDIPTEDAA